MELKEFIEKYIDNYEAKLSFCENEPFLKQFGELGFCDRYFYEALQNYTDIICEKQRENCVDEFKQFNKIEDITLHDIILCSRQPKIEEL